MKHIKRSIDQTGVAVFELENGEEKIIPTFSLKPVVEAKSIWKYLVGVKLLKAVYYSNNLMDYTMGDKIRDFVNEYGYLPRKYMRELASGFPFIIGEEPLLYEGLYK